MKFKEQNQFELNNPNARSRRLEVLLGAWRVPRFEYWASPATPPPNTELTGDDLRLWFEILRLAEPVSPRTHRAGFDVHARLQGLDADALVSDNAIDVVGERVALHGKVTGLAPRLYDWSLLVPEHIGERETEAILRRRFQDVQPFGDRWLVVGSSFNCTDSICVLVQDALIATTPEALIRVWQVALALHIEYRFLPALPAEPARRLAQKLAADLLAAADRLDVETDARLLLFALGRTDGPRIMPMHLPASRLAQLLEADRFLEQSRYRPGGSYYDAAASALVRVANNPFDVANVLLKLKPGSALLAALDSIAVDRPEFVAAYAFNQGFHAEGAFLLLQLAQRGYLAQGNHIDLSEEWLQVQRLGREQMLLNDQSIDWDSLVALGVHDESLALGRRHYGVAPIDRERAPYDGEALWRETVSAPARGPNCVAALERHFRAAGPHSDPSFVFALRLIGPLRDSGQHEAATQLATAIVEAYVADQALDTASGMPTALLAYGALLAQLRDVLDVHGSAWQRLLRPFDPEAYLKAALADQSNRTTSGRSPSYLVPILVRTHAEMLIALSAALDDGFEEPLHAALVLYKADRQTQLNVPAFWWNALARVSYGARHVGEPLFLTVGRLLRRVAGKPRWVEAFLHDVQEAHILGWVLAGLGTEHPLAKKFRPNLLAQLDTLIGPEHGIALGHALELANILQQAGMPEQSERFARYALQVVDKLQRGAHEQFGRTAQALLAVSLAQQGKWPDLLLFEPDRNAIVLSPPARVVEIMRAVALLKTGKPQAAEDALKKVLSVEPTNGMALVNLAAIPLQAQDWPGTIQAARRAKETVSGELRDDVILYEAHALEQLKDTHGAMRALAELSGEAGRREDVVATRQRLQGGDGTIVSVISAPVVETKVIDTLDDSVDIAIVTAVEQEYDAVCERLTNARFAPTGEGPLANFHGWQLGEIPKRDGSGRYTIVLATTGRAGNLESYRAISQTIERWNPRVVLFCGVAGGLKRDELTHGDIVLSETIWFYANGKIVDGVYVPRHRDYTPHTGLRTQGHIFARYNRTWLDCGVAPPSPNHIPKCLKGLIGSGDIVVDDLQYDFAAAILKARPELQAVEMEAAGADAAVQDAQEHERPVAFMMVRGISDMPKDGADASGAGTALRDAWKPYASAIAANFIVTWVASDAFPFLPRAIAGASDQDPDVTRQLSQKR